MKKLPASAVLLVLALIAVVSLTFACAEGEPADTAPPLTPETNGAEDGLYPGNGEGVDAAAVFGNVCASCHGQDGSGGTGPDLRQLTNVDAIEEQVRNGGGGMPAYEGQLTDEEIEAVSEYVPTLGE